MFVARRPWAISSPRSTERIQGIRAVLTGGPSNAPAPATAASGPLENQALAAAAVLIMSALVPVGWWQVWRRYRRQPWAVALAIGSLAWFVVVARPPYHLGRQPAGRAGIDVRVRTRRLHSRARRDPAHRQQPALADYPRFDAPTCPFVVAAAVVAALVLVFNGMVNGWPPYWERLPGPYQVGGFERSVGPEQIASADWALAALGPGNRFATDAGDYPVIGSYGDQDPVPERRLLVHLTEVHAVGCPAGQVPGYSVRPCRPAAQ